MSAEHVRRRNLPHWYMPGACYFLTFRLAGSIPRQVAERLKERMHELLSQRRPHGRFREQLRERVHKQIFAEYDRYLDAAQGVKWLEDSRVAALVRRSLYHWHAKKYSLMAYCIMPNHVHVVLQPRDRSAVSRQLEELSQVGERSDTDSPLSDIMHSIKSYTAHKANAMLRRAGGFWQHESYDHWIRDEAELERVVDYINANPVRAGLVAHAHEWFWGSAHDRYLADGDTSGWLAFEREP